MTGAGLPSLVEGALGADLAVDASGGRGGDPAARHRFAALAQRVVDAVDEYGGAGEPFQAAVDDERGAVPPA